MQQNQTYGLTGGITNYVGSYLVGDYFPKNYFSIGKKFANEKSAKSNLVDADNEPDYDDWGSDTYWTCDDWINWHKAMLQKYGREDADKRWVSAWLAGLDCFSGGTCTAPGSNYLFNSVPVDCRTFNNTFRNYIQKGENKKLYSAVYQGIGAVLATPLGWGADVTEGVSRGAKALRVIIPIAIVGVSGMFLYWGYKHFMTKRVLI